jgi:hypothetical protein
MRSDCSHEPMRMPGMNSHIRSQQNAVASAPMSPRAILMGSRMAAARRLHEYLLASHWNGHSLIGPDVGIRFNARIGRFVKGYLPRFSWNDNYSYVQAQGYWILGNWRLFSSAGESRFRDIALRTSEFLITRQQENGSWLYPNPEWQGRIATAEGTWGSLGLLESYRQTGERRFLTAALAWHSFLVREVGFQQVGEEVAVNYFHDIKGPRVPNNSAILLRFLAELADLSGNTSHLRLCSGLLSFLRAAQNSSGEFPYTVKGVDGGKVWAHFQCFQYNSFQCLDLMRYFDLAADDRVLPLINGSLRFLRLGLAESGRSYFQCGDHHREVAYHTAVLAHVFSRASEFGFPGYEAMASRAYNYLLRLQRMDGGFDFSRGDYYFLKDRRSYPRSLAMILCHLLPPLPVREKSALSAHIH